MPHSAVFETRLHAEPQLEFFDRHPALPIVLLLLFPFALQLPLWLLPIAAALAHALPTPVSIDDRILRSKPVKISLRARARGYCIAHRCSNLQSASDPYIDYSWGMSRLGGKV